MTRRLRLLLGALTVALFAALISAPAHAAGVKITATAYWHTCKPRAWAARPGGYMIYNDQFRGAPGKACISSTGYNLKVLTNAPGRGGVVTDSPMISYGEYFGYRDAQSRFPLPVTFAARTVLTRHFSCTGRAPGSWTCDAFDSFFSPSARTAGLHGNRELVVITRNNSGRSARPGARLVRISGHWWWAESWTTCPAAVGRCWPIMWFAEVHQAAKTQKLRQPAFIRYCIHRGWLPASEWLDNDPARVEIWSGGRGLRISIGKGDVIRLPPVIHQPGATS